MDRDRAALRQGRAVEREQARRRVESFLDDRRERAAQQRRLHLVGDAVELVAGDVDGDRVEFSHAAVLTSRALRRDGRARNATPFRPFPQYPRETRYSAKGFAMPHPTRRLGATL